MRVLVTGSSGHIGGAIARRLVESGNVVVGVSRSRRSDLPYGVDQRLFDVGRETVVEELLASVEPCEAVVHAAADLDLAPYAPRVVRTNCVGVQNMLHLAHTWDAKQFVFFSSVAAIGTPEQHPVTEEHPALFTTTYAATKLFGEHLVADFAQDNSFGVSFRVSSPIGPGMRARRNFSVYIENALSGENMVIQGTGGLRQDYVDVRDIARAVESALIRPVTGVLNIASGNTLSSVDLAHRIAATLQSSSEVCFEGNAAPDDDECWDVSTEKAQVELGFESTISVEDSILALADEMLRVQ